MSEPKVFDLSHYDRLNTAREAVVVNLIREIREPLGLKTAIDVGCGLGYFSGVLQKQGFSVTAVDGRHQNADEAARRFPGVHFSQCDAEDPRLRSFGKFDLVFCFGLLYHLENPLLTIRHLHAMTEKLLLVEGVIFPGEEPLMGLIDESKYDDQGLRHFAFYPTEACLVKMLFKSGFNHIYSFVIGPDHPEYHSATNSRRTRTMVAASHEPLETEQLKSLEEPSSPILPWDPSSGIEPRATSMQKLESFLTRSFSKSSQAKSDY